MDEDKIRTLLTDVAQEINYRFNQVLTDEERIKYRYSNTYILTSENGLQIRVAINTDEKTLPSWRLGLFTNLDSNALKRSGVL